ncbi:MAG: heavy metal translocating P-type ATPase metal-binding domain-containing protein [Puniceicoccaceae bacterium]|nr:heavy metal translocating P-type ATPase metal-binding domain-containing protein [Puniceicoccaceae bacterium]
MATGRIIKQNCKHCGLSFLSATSDVSFCCLGCAQVYELIHSKGLEAFYDLRNGAGKPTAIDNSDMHQSDFAWVDMLQQESQTNKSPSELRVQLSGLTCLGCSWLVEHLFMRRTGAVLAKVSLEENSLWLRWEPKVLNISAFLEELRTFGYLASPISKSVTARWSALTWQLVLCMLFAFNGVLLSFAQTSTSIDIKYQGLFHLLELCFSLISIFVGGSYFFVPVWRSLQARFIHYDFLITLGLLLFIVTQFFFFFTTSFENARLWQISLLISLLLFGRWWHARIVHGKLVLPTEGIAIRRVQLLLPLFTRGVLCSLLLFFIINYHRQGPQIIESTTAALLAGTLYPIARIVQNCPPAWMVIIGFLLVFISICIGATNLLTPLWSCALASTIGVIWLHALKVISWVQA